MAALIGARGPTRPAARDAACEIVGHALGRTGDEHLEDRRRVAQWIAEIYPPPDPSDGVRAADPESASETAVEFWGSVQPDRLGEFLVARILVDEPDLPTALARCADVSGTPAGTPSALLIMSRAALHHTEINACIDTLILENPGLFGAAAIWVALYSENPSPLHEALIRLGTTDPATFIVVVATQYNPLPGFSLSRLTSNAALTAELTNLHRRLVEIDRDTHLPYLAMSLNNHAIRLTQVGRRDEAVRASEEAVRLCRRVVEDDRKTYLTLLAESLDNRAGLLAEMGRPAEALPMNDEAVQYYTELVKDNPAVLPDLVLSLDIRADLLAGVGWQALALRASNGVIRLCRELVKNNRDAHLPRLAKSLSNHAHRLAQAERRDEAVPVSEEAVQYFQELVEDDRDAHLPDLARSLTTHAMGLAQTGRPDKAVPVCAEAARLYRGLAEINRDIYLPDYAMSLVVLGRMMIEGGRFGEAVDPLITAVSVAPDLPDSLKEFIGLALPDLHKAYSSDLTGVTEIYKRLTGSPLPDWIKEWPDQTDSSSLGDQP